MTNTSLPTILSGVAGEYFVAAELSRRGYIASITLRNTRGIDILVAAADATKSVGIQVKTNQGSAREWILNQKVEIVTDGNLFYVFVNLNGIKASPNYHVVPSRIVADYCKYGHANWLAEPGKKGQQRKDSSVRKFADPTNQYLDKWEILGLDHTKRYASEGDNENNNTLFE